MAQCIDNGFWRTEKQNGDIVSLIRQGGVKSNVWQVLSTCEAAVKEHVLRTNTLNGMQVIGCMPMECHLSNILSGAIVTLEEPLSSPKKAGKWLDYIAKGCTVYQAIVRIIASNNEMPESEVTPISHIIHDLNLDEFTFNETILDIEEVFEAKLTHGENLGDVFKNSSPKDEYFFVKNLAHHVQKQMN